MRRHTCRLATLGAGLLALLTATCASAAPAQRIVSLGGPVTETLYVLGQGDRVVGVDTTSTYPAAARKLPSVGYLRTLGAEGILSLHPDLIIASNEAGPPPVIAQLRSAGVRVEVVQTSPDPAAALAGMARTADLVGRHADGKALVTKLHRQLNQLHERMQQTTRVRTLFVLGGQGGQPLIAGRDTKADHMLALAGATNVATSFSGYRPGGPEALVKLAPAAIVVASHGLAAYGSIDQLLDQTGLRMTPAGQAGHVYVMDTELLLGMGPRMADAATALANKLHGEPTVQVSND